MTAATPDRAATVIQPDSGARLLFHLVFPLLGGGAGWLLRQAAGWAESVRWMPYQGPLELIDSWPEPHTTIAAIVLGVLAGAIVGYLAENESLKVIVTDDDATFGTGPSATPIRRASTTAVFIDHKELKEVVVLGPGTEEVLRHKADMGRSERDRLAIAFDTHGWPWHDGDPHHDQYRRWVEGTPLLPVATNAILKARQRALDRGDRDDAQQLREELARLDIVVRDDDAKRQFWRAAGSAP
ncbi:YqeB family protein [Phytoactinopolyspora limicola]|uniref:YqeB family protein n=1 Tax=Phytoactinopolyspora limicola TaxID=2715536 RepID=UPI001407C968|nr:hypothetical protein [Phytoactinopolyspora limicola]